MRTNYSGFALAVCMGLVVLLLGFLALSAGGLVQLGPPEEVTATVVPGDSTAQSISEPAFTDVVIYRTTLPPDNAAIMAGDALFKANCAQCHAVNERVVGPALAGILLRRRLPWVTTWVRNSAKVIASGDEYAVKLFNDNGKQQMPGFPQLSDKEIKSILTWVEAQQGGIVSTSTVAMSTR